MDVQGRILRQNSVELVIADGIAQGIGIVAGENRLTDVVADEQIGVVGNGIAENQNPDRISVVGKCKPYLFRFCNRGDRKEIGARRGKRSGTLPRAVSVGIRLDDTADAAVGDGANRIEIMNQML